MRVQEAAEPMEQRGMKVQEQAGCQGVWLQKSFCPEFKEWWST
eukprot:gene10593-5897_t